MDVPARLKWRNETNRYAAYPVGDILPDRVVWIQPYTPVYQSWKWVVSWEGWFSEADVASSKQEAADRATEAWWRLVQTEIPRDVDFEATTLVARVLVRPMPNSLLSDEPKFIQTVLWHLKNVYRKEISEGAAPAVVTNWVEQLEAEIERRMVAGEIKRPIVVVPQKMRRRRR